ncbi:MAG: MarR family winged helix-turn-helix transcriptional regulator [Dorea formicigenerans]
MNDKWMESGFMLIQQVAHLAKYQTLKEMESCGLKPNQAGILVVLRSEGGLSQKSLLSAWSDATVYDSGAEKMEKQGYVLREQDEKDQRITRIRISDQGIECLNGLQHMMRNLEKRLYEGISAEERQEMKETLLKMRENVLRYKEFQGMDMCEIMEKTRPPKMPEKSI